jgi:hypothetical protein
MPARLGYIDLSPRGLIAAFIGAIVGLVAGTLALELANRWLGLEG